MSLLAQTSTQQLVTSSITAVTAQFQTLSTQTFNVSSINGIVPGAAFSGSTVALSTGLITTNTLATNSINMNGGTVSNVASNFFTTPKFTTTFTPTSISGLRVWFDASQTTTILSNGSGQVYQWNNLAPGYPNALQTTTANQPYTGLSNYNGLNTISFTNTNTSILNIASISYSNSYRSFFVVYQFPGTYTTGALSITDGVTIFNAPDYPSFKFGHTATPGFYNGYTIPSSSYRAGFGVLTGSLNSSLGSPFYYNGSNNAIVSGANSLFTSASYTGTIGGGNPINICEYIGYDSELTSNQRLIVEGYLAWKWGFQSSLISIHPYFSVAPPPLGIVYLPAGSLGTDATSNITIQATANTKISLAGNTQITGLLTTSSIGISSINNSTLTQLITQPFQSTFTGLTQSLGTAGYISTAQLTSTVRGIGSGFTGSTIGLSAATINTSTINSIYLSSVQGYISSLRTDSLTVGGPTGYVTVQDLTTATISTGQLVAGAGFISSLQINTLSFGPTGYVIVGDVIANSLSTTRLNTQALYTNNAYIGNVSSQSAILFPGIDGNYRGTAIAERTTGVGTGELLLYKVSSTTDQIRLQTTGNIVFEAGAASRSWNSTTQLATPTLYIQGSTSNVGVGTATPATTLDVAGTGRFQTLSSFALNVSTINGIVPGAAFNGSTLGLSTATLTTSTLATNALTTSSITSYGTVDIQGSVLSNVGTEYFIKPLYTTTFTPTSISGLKVWFDASKPASITSNGSGQVATWSNLTGLGNAVQITASNTPVTGQLSINSLNTMQFNAISQMTFGPISYSNTSRIVFAVLVTPFNPSVNGKTTFIFGGQADGSIGTAGFHAYQWSGSGFEFTTSTGGGQSAGYITYTSLVNAGTFSSSTAWLLTYHSGFGIFLNGTSNAPSSNLNTGSITDIFGTTAQGTNVNSFYIAEFLHYDTSFTATQRQTVEGYLAWKWGFQATLNGAHPYLSVPPPPLGTVLLAMGGITADTSSNISFSATNKIRLTAPVEIPTTLNTSSITVSTINGSTLTQLVSQPLQSTVQGLGTAGYISTAAFQSTVAGINYAISQNTVDTVFYLNPGTAATTYRQMSPSQTTFQQSTMTTFITKNTSNIPIAQFQTDFTVPQVIPDGAWDLNLFAYTDHARTYIYTSLFSRAGATETLIASSSNATTNIGTSPVQQYTNTLFVPQTIFTSTTGVSLVLKVFANNPVNHDDNLYTYYQGGTYSHTHTTFGTVVPDTLFTSTVAGLGTAGYVSTLVNLRMISSLEGYVSSFRTDSLTVGGPTGFVTVQDLTTATISTGQIVAGAGFISSLQINSLSFGPSGYVIVGDVIANSLSTTRLNTQALYANNAYIGNVSSQSAILFPGIDGNYRGTAVAERTTGTGTGELLLYKVSSTTDQIRLQTTGNLVFEAGAASRSWNSTTQLATPTLYIAGSTSNVGIGTATPAATLDVVGTGRFQTVSSLALNVSSINGAAPGGTFNGSTLALSTGSVYASNVVVKNNGNVGSNTYGIGIDTLIVQTNIGALAGGIASLYFGASNPTYPLARIGAVDYGVTYGNSALVFQTATPTNASLSGVITYSYSNANQSFTVPSGITSVTVYMWGAGGGGGSGTGGAGAFIQGTLAVTPGNTLTVIVGGGGVLNGGGTFGGGGSSGQANSASGGGRSAIQLSGTELVDVGGGGGGSYSGFQGGAANYSPTINGGAGYRGGQATYGGYGGTQTAGGAVVTGPVSTGTAGSYLQGGAGGNYGGGGGGGFYGGGGGSTAGGDGCAGGGGSSYTTNAAFTLITGSNSPNTGAQAPATASPYYVSGVAAGATGSSTGGSGLVVIVYNPPYNLSETMRISQTGSIGIGTSTPQTLLHVSGMTYSIAISTQALTVSSINGAAVPTPFSTDGLGTLGYISSTQLGSTVTNLITRIGAGGGGGGTTFVGSTTFLSASQILFSTQTGYNISSVLGFVSSLQVDELQIGTGFGIIAFGDTNMSSISTLGIAAGLGNFQTINVSSINGAIPGTGSGGTTFTGTLGTVSSLTALRFFGLTGGFTNTAVAEVSTGTGLQELLLYKVSSVSDQVRVQTTGNVIFETGVGARGWPTAPRVLPPTLYIAGSNSNVGIGTSNPVTALDVAGTGRFQTLSSLNITAGSINYSVAFV